MSQLVRALLIEPDAKRSAAIVGALAQATVKVSVVDSLSSSMLRCDVDRFDCIISALSLPEGSGPALIQRLRQLIPPVPLIVVGDSDHESVELLALGAGADEYIGREQIPGARGLARTVRRAIARDGAEQRRREDHHTERETAMGQIASAVAHQINNPLAFIGSNNAVLRSYIEDLVEGLGDLSQAGIDAEWLEAWRDRYDIERSLDDARQICIDNGTGLKRISAVVSDLSSYSRPAQETRRFVDLNAVIERAYWRVEPALRDRARVEWQLSPLPPLLGEARHLEDVFVHLLRNAMQALEPTASNDHRVTIRTGTERDQIVATVTDTGCGVPQAARPRVFEPFFSTRAAGDGAGLGLAVCDQVATRHGGEVDLESTGAKGTRSVLRLPASARPPSSERRDAAAVLTGWSALGGRAAAVAERESSPSAPPPARRARRRARSSRP